MVTEKLREKSTLLLYSIATFSCNYQVYLLIQDKLIDAYEENGVFPTTIGDNGESNKPIRCHYRPRSFVPALCFGVWSCFCLPLMFNSLKWFLGSGLMSFVAALLIFGMSKSTFKLIVLLFFLLMASYIYSGIFYLQADRHHIDQSRFLVWKWYLRCNQREQNKVIYPKSSNSTRAK